MVKSVFGINIVIPFRFRQFAREHEVFVVWAEVISRCRLANVLCGYAPGVHILDCGVAVVGHDNITIVDVRRRSYVSGTVHDDLTVFSVSQGNSGLTDVAVLTVVVAHPEERLKLD